MGGPLFKIEEFINNLFIFSFSLKTFKIMIKKTINAVKQKGSKNNTDILSNMHIGQLLSIFKTLSV